MAKYTFEVPYTIDVDAYVWGKVLVTIEAETEEEAKLLANSEVQDYLNDEYPRDEGTIEYGNTTISLSYDDEEVIVDQVKGEPTVDEASIRICKE